MPVSKEFYLLFYAKVQVWCVSRLNGTIEQNLPHLEINQK